MLLRFSVTNHLSIKDQQALSLTASPLKDSERGLIECDAAPYRRVLPAAVIYGANASGKSNLVDALRYMRARLLYSYSKGEPGAGVPRQPFALDSACAEAPSIFDVDFVVDRVRHHYGFEASDEAFSAEWLYNFPNNRRQVLFEREGKAYKFGRALRGHNRIIADLTRPNSLFISAAAQSDHEQLLKIARFFQSIGTDTQISIEGKTASVYLAEGEVDSRVIDFLRDIGTGVMKYRRLEEELSEMSQNVQREFVSFVQKIMPDSRFETWLNEHRSVIQLAHQGRDENPVFLDLDRESAGTRRLLMLLGRVFAALHQGAPLLVDELDASLHTQACEAILTLFCSRDTNPSGAQIIATTHDTNLLRSPLLRRDQIWFTEKDSEGATHLYPLTDIRTRQGDNIEKGYLQGRYGAIPFAGRIPNLAAAG
jgi:AAA15 family ATPase/GTPase